MMTNNPQPVNGLAELSNLTLCDIAIERALSRTNGLPGIVCLYGFAGYGKTKAAVLVALRRRAIYIQAKSVWRAKDVLKAIMKNLSLDYKSMTTSDMLEEVARELAQSGRPLIIDEMDNIVRAGITEVIRDIYEACQAPILIIGEEGIPAKLERWEKFHSRVLSWVPAQPVTLEDTHKLLPIYAPEIEIEDDLLEHLVDLSGGSVRRVSVNLEIIAKEAATLGLTYIDRDIWGKRSLYTGKSPKRRKL